MRILLCDSSSYSPLNPYFVEPLGELSLECGYKFTFVDEANFIPSKASLSARIYRKIVGEPWRSRGHRLLNGCLVEAARSFRPDLVILVNGKYVTPATLHRIKDTTGALIANYATDDPWNPAVTTRYFRDAVGIYDIYATPKKALMSDLASAGCKMVLRTLLAYKPSVHYPDPSTTADEIRRYNCDVAFIGSCDSDRIDYFHTLIRELPTVRLHIYGAGDWGRYPALRPYTKGIVLGRDFRIALASTKIALNFIRHANRDDHSERTFQIPACGAFMLAERTDEQIRLLAEGREAAYFQTPQELVEKVRRYLKHDSDRDMVAMAGHRRIINGGNTCKDRLLQILTAASQMIDHDAESKNANRK